MRRPTPALAALLLCALAGCAKEPGATGPLIPPKVVEKPIYVVELGDGVHGLAGAVVKLCSEVAVVAIPLKPLPLDPRLRNPQRGQFLAEDLLGDLQTGTKLHADTPGTFVFAITAADMFPRAWPSWSFANAWSAEGRFAVLSVAHLDPARTGGAPDPALFTRRLRKVLFRTLGELYFRLPMPEKSAGLMRQSAPTLESLDALPDGFTAEDLARPLP